MEIAARIRLLWLGISLGIIALPCPAGAAKPPRCPAGSQPVPKSPRCIMPVTTVIGSLDSNGLPADIASDGLGPYSNGISGVTSFLTDNGYNGIAFGDWQFDTYASTARFVSHSIDPEDAVQPGDPHYTAPANPPFWGTQVLTSRLTTKCTLINNNMLAMTAGSSFTCPMINKFNVGNIDYHLNAAQAFDQYPEVTDALVRCNATDSLGCKDWFIDPIGLGQAVGRLVPTGTTINDGNFYMRFHIHITRP
jgi:hypothetical protein